VRSASGKRIGCQRLEGLSRRDIIRCLKRFVAREIYHALLDDHRVGAACAEAA